MEKKPYPSETQERFIVRLPDGMRDRIAEAAKANNRSMNAEIVSRLADSFVQEAHQAEFGKPYEPAPPGINVVIDARGYPISWDEINEHLAAIRKTGKFNVVAMHTAVMTPELVSSSEREEKTAEVAEFYKNAEEKAASLRRIEARNLRRTPIDLPDALEGAPPAPRKPKK